MRSIVVDPEGRLLIGIEERIYRRGVRVRTEYHLREFDADSGAELNRQDTEGAMIGIAATNVYLYATDPDRVLVHSLQP